MSDRRPNQWLAPSVMDGIMGRLDRGEGTGSLLRYSGIHGSTLRRWKNGDRGKRRLAAARWFIVNQERIERMLARGRHWGDIINAVGCPDGYGAHNLHQTYERMRAAEDAWQLERV